LTPPPPPKIGGGDVGIDKTIFFWYFQGERRDVQGGKEGIENLISRRKISVLAGLKITPVPTGFLCSI